jgi:hypothetical protein
LPKHENFKEIAELLPLIPLEEYKPKNMEMMQNKKE